MATVMTQKNISKKMYRAAETLEASIQRARRQLLELGVAQSVQELREGKGKTYTSATAFMRTINIHA